MRTIMKRKILFIFLCVFVLVGLTSCLDSVQAISYDNGQYYWYFKLTVSKMLMEIAGEDPESFFEGFDEEELGDLPDFVSLNRIDSDLELGFEITAYLDPNSKDEDVIFILPKENEYEYYIPFFVGYSNMFNSVYTSDDSEKEIAQAMLSSAKCRVMVGKNIIPYAEGAYIPALDDSWYGEDYKMPVYDYGDSYCVEVPCLILLESEEYDLSRIVFVKETQ